RVFRDFDAKSVLERHHQLDGVQAVGAQIIYKGRLWHYAVLRRAQLRDDDVLGLFGDVTGCVAHRSRPSVAPTAWRREPPVGSRPSGGSPYCHWTETTA